MKHHVVMTVGLQAYLEDEQTKWHTYAQSSREQKRLQVQIGSECYRVLHGQEIVYEGGNVADAVRAFNEITIPPTNIPKTDN